jgi:predicted dehydrogenase
VGLIGCGRFGTKHSIAWRKAGLEVACYDCDEKLAEKLSKQEGLTRYDNLNDLFEFCDIVSIAVPPLEQGCLALSALKAGKHIHLEKPGFWNRRIGQILVKLSQKNVTTLNLGFIERHSAQKRNIIDRFGIPETISVNRESKEPNHDCVGIIRDLMCHDIEHSISLFGPPEKIEVLDPKVEANKLVSTCLKLEFSKDKKAFLRGTYTDGNHNRISTYWYPNTKIEADLKLQRTYIQGKLYEEYSQDILKDQFENFVLNTFERNQMITGTEIILARVIDEIEERLGSLHI